MDRDGARFSVSLAAVEFKPDNAGARLIYTEHGAHFDSADGIRMREAGWRELLGKLDDYLASAS